VISKFFSFQRLVKATSIITKTKKNQNQKNTNVNQTRICHERLTTKITNEHTIQSVKQHKIHKTNTNHKHSQTLS